MKQVNKRKILVKKLEAKPRERGERAKLNKVAEKGLFKSQRSG